MSSVGGAALFAAVGRLAPQAASVEGFAIDQSSGALAILEEIHHTLSLPATDMKLETRPGELTHFLKWPAGSFDLLLASFSLNEALQNEPWPRWMAWIRQALARLRPGGLLLILEPALDEASERFRRLRDALAADTSVQLWGPCLHAAQCPLAETKRYCHEVRRWQAPDSWKQINGQLYHDAQSLKYQFLAVSNQRPASQEPETVRLISPLAEKKGLFLTTVCTSQGLLEHVEIPTRGLTKASWAELRELERGDWLRLRACARVGNRLRVAYGDLDVVFS